jgi:hypothetical protein
MNIKSSDFVLEIGSGHNPQPCSDVLCDKLPEDDTERGGEILIDRPFIAADGQYLPFADKSFDYVICCSVLEHAEDVSLFISEIIRVGKAGYIEVPSEIGEKLYGWDYHKWIFKLSDSNKLIIKKKTKNSQFGQLFHYLYKNDQDYAKFHTNHHKLFLIQFEWFNKIDYEIIESNDDLVDLNDLNGIKNLLNQQTNAGISGFIKRMMPSGIRRLVKNSIVKSYGKNRRALKDIQHIIVCPVCKNQVQWQDELISCLSCNRKYPIRRGIPFLKPEK